MHIYKHIKHKNKLFALFIIFLLHCYNSYSYYWGEMDNKTDKKTNRRSEKMYVIVIEWDNTEPQVYGTFKTTEEAEAKKTSILNGFDSWEWNHHRDISITKITK